MTDERLAKIHCTHCNGSGAVATTDGEAMDCPWCDGEGHQIDILADTIRNGIYGDDRATGADIEAALGALATLLDALTAARAEVEEARQDERAKVVAYLDEHGGYPGARGLMAAALAEGVEEGERLGRHGVGAQVLALTEATKNAFDDTMRAFREELDHTREMLRDVHDIEVSDAELEMARETVKARPDLFDGTAGLSEVAADALRYRWLMRHLRDGLREALWEDTQSLDLADLQSAFPESAPTLTRLQTEARKAAAYDELRAGVVALLNEYDKLDAMPLTASVPLRVRAYVSGREKLDALLARCPEVSDE